MKLYKFFSLSTLEQVKRVADLVSTACLFAPARETFNDPFEAMVGLQNRDKDDFKKYLTNKSFQEQGVICFTTRWDQDAFWGYYGDSFSGCCVEFDTSQCQVLNRARPVKYHPLSWFKEEGRSEEDLSFAKLKGWRNEDEYRIVTKRVGYVQLGPRCIGSVKIGLKSHEIAIMTLAQVCRDSEIPFHIIDYGEEKLISTPVKVPSRWPTTRKVEEKVSLADVL